MLALHTQDLYILVSGLQYKQALADWAAIGGAPTLPPLSGTYTSYKYPLITLSLATNPRIASPERRLSFAYICLSSLVHPENHALCGQL